jgi:hypothetical protein
MTTTLFTRSPHLAAVTTVAVAVLGAAVLALEPGPAQQVAARAAVSAVPTCADFASLSARTRPIEDPATAGSLPDPAAGPEGPPT